MPPRHSSGSCKAGAAAVPLVQPSLRWYLFHMEARLQQLRSAPEKPQTPEQQKKWEVMSQNWHLVLPGKAGLPFGPDPGTLPWKTSGPAGGVGGWGQVTGGRRQSHLSLSPFSRGSVAPHPIGASSICFIFQAVAWVDELYCESVSTPAGGGDLISASSSAMGHPAAAWWSGATAFLTRVLRIKWDNVHGGAWAVTHAGTLQHSENM